MKTYCQPVSTAAPALSGRHQALALLALLMLVGLTFWLLPRAVGSLWQEARYSTQHGLGSVAPTPAPAPNR